MSQDLASPPHDGGLSATAPDLDRDTPEQVDAPVAVPSPVGPLREEEDEALEPVGRAEEDLAPSPTAPVTSAAPAGVGGNAKAGAAANGSVHGIAVDSPTLVQQLKAAAAAASPAGGIGSTPKRAERPADGSSIGMVDGRATFGARHEKHQQPHTGGNASPTSLATLFRSLSPRKRAKAPVESEQAEGGAAGQQRSHWGPIQSISLPIGRPTSPLSAEPVAASGAPGDLFGKILGAHGSTLTLRQERPFKNLSTPDNLALSGAAAGRASTISGHLSDTNLRFPEPDTRVTSAADPFPATNATTTASTSSNSLASSAGPSRTGQGVRSMPTSGSVPLSLADLARAPPLPVEYRPLKGSASQGELRATSSRSPANAPVGDVDTATPLTPPQQSSENWTTASQTLPPSHRWKAQTMCDQFVLPKPRLVPLEGSPPGRPVDDAVFVIQKGQDEPYVVRSTLVDPFDDTVRRPSTGTMSSMIRTSSRGTASDGRKRSGSLGSQIRLLSEKPLAETKKGHTRSKSASSRGAQISLKDPFSLGGQEPASPPISSSFGFLAPSSASSKTRSRQNSQTTSVGSLASSISNRFGSGRAQRKRAASISHRADDLAITDGHGASQSAGRALATSTSSPDLRQLKSREMPPTQSHHRRQRSSPGAQHAADEGVVLIGSHAFKEQSRPSHRREKSSDKPLPPLPFADRVPKQLPVLPRGSPLTPVSHSPTILPVPPQKSPRGDPLRAVFERQQLQAGFRLPRHAPPPPPVTEPISPQRVPTFPLTRTPPSGMKRGIRSPAPEPLPLSTVRALAARTQGSPTRKKASIEEAVERARSGASLLSSAGGSPRSGHSRQHSASSTQDAGSGNHHGLLAAAGILESQRVSRQQQRDSVLSPASAGSEQQIPSMTFSGDDTLPSSHSDPPRSAVSPETNFLTLPMSPMSPNAISPQDSQLTQASFDDMAVFDKELFFASPKRPVAEPSLRPSFRLPVGPSIHQGDAAGARPLSEATSPVDMFLSGERAKSPLGGLIDARQLEGAASDRASNAQRPTSQTDEDAITPTGVTGPFTGMFDSPKLSQGDSEDHLASFGQGMDSERPEVEHKRSDDTLFRVRSVFRGQVSPEQSDANLPLGRQAISMYRTSIVPELGPVIGTSGSQSSSLGQNQMSPRLSSASTASDIRDSGAFSFVDSFPAPPPSRGPPAAGKAREELISDTASSLAVRRPVELSRTTTDTSAMTGASFVTAEDMGSIQDDD